ncbi:hypothetical protein, partial [Serratia marcescens]|uniref:hypothetical protein n=1 Tax=Serratia marcescens TaxID=615 RepID=UPI002812A3A5
MWYVITDGPMEIMKAVPPTTPGGETTYVKKPRHEWTTEDKKKNNLDCVAKDIFYRTVGKNLFHKIKNCETAKEIWEMLIMLHGGSETTKENKLMVANQKYEQIKMNPG